MVLKFSSLKFYLSILEQGKAKRAVFLPYFITHTFRALLIQILFLHKIHICFMSNGGVNNRSMELKHFNFTRTNSNMETGRELFCLSPFLLYCFIVYTFHTLFIVIMLNGSINSACY